MQGIAHNKHKIKTMKIIMNLLIIIRYQKTKKLFLIYIINAIKIMNQFKIILDMIIKIKQTKDSPYI